MLKKKLIKAVFVILLVPLAEMVSPPLQIISPANGNAASKTIDHIKSCKEQLHKFQSIYKSFGVSFDSDKQPIKLHNDSGGYWSSYLHTYKSSRFETFLKSIKPSEMVICDPPHLLKRARYYIVNNDEFSIEAIDKPVMTRSRIIEDLTGITNIIFMRNSRNTKMDDNYPRVFFRAGVLYSLMGQNNWPAVGMFLPATVLCCYFYIEQSRKQTLKILTIAFFFVRMIYKAQTGSKYHSMYYSKTHATAKNEEYSKQILVDVHLQRKDVTDSQKKDKVSPLLDEQ